MPEDVQLACAEMADQVYDMSGRDTTLKSETIGSYSYTNAVDVVMATQSPTMNAIRDKLYAYRRHSV